MTDAEIVELALLRVSDNIAGVSPAARVVKVQLRKVAEEILNLMRSKEDE